ncbi:MAG: DUF4304 domain-containing protein [Burkholderiales bacterium]|nr:MAG: DUF4304 domain-containing protein [Burkholderiales bacterium]
MSAKSYKSVKNCVARHLSEHGFVARDFDTLEMKVDGVSIILEFQKDKDCKGDVTRFTVSIAIFIGLLMSNHPPSEGLTLKKPSLSDSHWWDRLGKLLPVDADVWWCVSNEQSAQTSCAEIVEGVVNHALPKIKEIASVEALLGQWKSGVGHGLTEYQRHLYLGSSQKTENKAR